MRSVIVFTMVCISTMTFADSKVIKMSGVEYLETGEEVFKKVNNSELKVGEKIILQDKSNPQATTEAEIIKVMDQAVIFKTVK